MCALTEMQLGCLDASQAIRVIRGAQCTYCLPRYATNAQAIYNSSDACSRSRLQSIMCALTAMQLECLDVPQAIRVIRKAQWSC